MNFIELVSAFFFSRFNALLKWFTCSEIHQFSVVWLVSQTYTQLWNHHHCNTGHFDHLKKFPCDSLQSAPSSRQAATDLPSVTIVLPFVEFRINGIILVSYCNFSLIWLCVVIMRFIHVACMVVCFFLLLSSDPLFGCTTTYLFTY